MLPIMLIWIGLPVKELQMKERKAVDQLVLSIALALSEGRELANEPALLQVLKITLAIAAGRNPLLSLCRLPPLKWLQLQAG